MRLFQYGPFYINFSIETTFILIIVRSLNIVENIYMNA